MDVQSSKTNTDFSTFKEADRIVEISYAIMSGFSLSLAPFYDTWLIALTVNLLLIISYYSAKSLMPNSRFYQFLGSFNLAIYAALLIYQMHGMLEMHFVLFIGSIVLMFYKDWRLQLPLTLAVVVHHSSFAYIQYLGYKEIYFTSANYMELQAFILHILLAAVIFFLCGFWSFKVEKQDKKMEENNRLMSLQISQIQKSIALAKNISNGALDLKENIDQNDELGQALVNMQQNLKQAKLKEEQDKFLNVGVAKLVEIMRQQHLSVKEICEHIVSFLVKYSQSNQGAIFLINDDGPKSAYLEMIACYAFGRKKYLSKNIEIGEGLVGQVFLEKETTLLTEVPNSYIQITSGLGEANPKSVVLVPMIYNDLIYGVIELASFTVPEKHVVLFFEKAAENIASVLSNLKSNEKNNQVLANLQVQSEEMKAQEEEMRQNMEELMATQEEMNRRQKEFLEREKILLEKLARYERDRIS